jgi:hypothetical protein
MGQVALGFRSLLVKLAVFFVMAALLAWALGGTLWPRAETYDFPTVRFDGRDWYWRLAVGGRNGQGELIRYMLLISEPDGDTSRFDGRQWVDAAGPVLADDALFVAGLASFGPDEPWQLFRIDGVEAEAPRAMIELPDRLAVERQFERLRAGLPLQDSATIRHHRENVLDPTSPMDDETP